MVAERFSDSEQSEVTQIVMVDFSYVLHGIMKEKLCADILPFVLHYFYSDCAV